MTKEAAVERQVDDCGVSTFAHDSAGFQITSEGAEDIGQLGEFLADRPCFGGFGVFSFARDLGERHSRFECPIKTLDKLVRAVDVQGADNLKHFPEDALAAYGIEAQHLDQFVSHLFDIDAGAVCAAVRDQRRSLKNPPLSVDELLNEFLARELAETVAQLQTMQQLL